MAREMRMSKCHPERKHSGKGLCKLCLQRVWKKENPEKVKTMRRNSLVARKKVRSASKVRLLSFFGNKCNRCDYDDPRALQIDHINGDGVQERKRGGRAILSYEHYHRIITESVAAGENKYQLLCANCNWIKRFENHEHR